MLFAGADIAVYRACAQSWGSCTFEGGPQLWMELGCGEMGVLGSTTIRGITEVWLCLRGTHVETADRWLKEKTGI